MNRQALKILLQSGGLLCFDCRGPYHLIRGREDTLDPKKVKDEPLGQENSSRAGLLFDAPALNLGIFFKEVSYSEDGEDAFVSTRVYYPYNDEDVSQGGESTSAKPETISRVLATRGAISSNSALSAHDQRMLEVLSDLPTFDPFLLLSRRKEMELERPIDNTYFDISGDDWLSIRRPVMEKISLLISKATGGAKVDVYQEFIGESGNRLREETNSSRMMASAVIDAIWQGEATESCQQLIKSFQLSEDRTSEILFAWKGINYYEYQYKKYKSSLLEVFKWLGGPDSFPRDASGLDEATLERFSYQRTKVRKMVRATYRNVTSVLDNYNTAFLTLINEENPKLFQNFLFSAPKNFLTVGLATGVLVHTLTAWRNATANAKRNQLRARDLEAFYDFIVAINGQDFRDDI